MVERARHLRVAHKASLVGSQESREGGDHTLDVRDSIMNFINNETTDPQRQAAARTSVFTDLSDAEIAQYSAFIQEDVEAVQREDPLSLLNDPEFKTIRSERPYRMAALPINPIKNKNEAQCFANQVKALRPINTAVDLTPHWRFLRRRDYNAVEPIMRSVVRPLLDTYAITNNLLPVEETLHRFRVGDGINWDCDQLRAMIKIFATAPQRPFPGDRLYDEGDDPYSWTLDQFRLALKVVTRPELTGFLKQRGPKSGQANKVCQLGWEFFKKRAMLGLGLVNAGVGYGDAAGVRQKTEEGGRLQGGEEGGGGEVENSGGFENGGEDGTDNVEIDEFHDAREIHGAVSDASGASVNDSATDGPRTLGRDVMGSPDHGSPVSGASDEGASDVDRVPGVDTGAQRSKRGRAVTTAEPAEPAPIKKRLRSGRNL